MSRHRGQNTPSRPSNERDGDGQQEIPRLGTEGQTHVNVVTKTVFYKWLMITRDPFVLESIQGYKIHFSSKPVQNNHPCTLRLTSVEEEAMTRILQTLINIHEGQLRWDLPSDATALVRFSFGVIALFLPTGSFCYVFNFVLCSLGVLTANSIVSMLLNLFNVCAAFSDIDGLICFDASVITV